MNNETLSSLIDETIFDAYISTLTVYTYLGSFAILTYASLLHFPDELEYIWREKFTLPTFLYLCSKYPVFFYFSLSAVEFLFSEAITSSLSLCNDLEILIQSIEILPFIGVQGLILIRTYALCRLEGYRTRMIALSIMLLAVLAALGVQLYELTIPLCSGTSPISSNTAAILQLINNIAIILLDAFAFIAIVRQVLGLWKMKRSLGLKSNQDLVTSLIGQGFLRFSFVLFITVTGVFLVVFAQGVADIFIPFQNVLSTLLICEFTLDLRRRNSKKSVPNQSALDLPTLSFRDNPVRSVLGRLHESIIVEMGERNDLVDIDVASLGVPDDLRDGSPGPNLVPVRSEIDQSEVLH